jgi:hypothetical protein
MWQSNECMSLRVCTVRFLAVEGSLLPPCNPPSARFASAPLQIMHALDGTWMEES